MSYIGNTQNNQNYVPAIDYFNGDGSTVAFTLSRPVASVAAVQAVINNVPQNPGSAFTVSGSTITFTSAPPSGTNNIYVYYTSPNTQVVQPGQGTVGTTQLQSDLTLTNPTYTGTLTGGTGVVNIGSGQIYKDASGNVGFGTNSPGYKLDAQRSGSGVVARFGNGTQHAYIYADTTSAYYGSNAAETNCWQISESSSFIAGYTAGSERMRIDSSGNLLFNSGYGSVATAYGCRAWVKFNGQGTVAINGSGNVSSIQDVSVGYFIVNFASALTDVNYAAVGGTNHYNGVSANGTIAWEAPYSTTQLGMYITSGNTSYDPSNASVAIFR